MNLSDYMKPSCVVTNVDARDKWDVLQKVTDILGAAGALEAHGVTPKEVLAALCHREETQSTGIGMGIAMPHARIKGFNGMLVSFVTLRNPVDFASLDHEPVKLVWTIIVAEEAPTLALQAYAKIQEFMRDEAIRRYFASVEDADLLRDYVCQRRISVVGSLTARDIMRTPRAKVLPGTPLRDVVRVMRQHHLEAIAVEDDQGHVVGEITCDRLFQFGVPDFFNQLQSIAFINRFDPFERYFDEEAHATASDVMQANYSVMPPEATMLEVVFALTVNRHPKIYVVENGCRIGTIDRVEVLGRILDF